MKTLKQLFDFENGYALDDEPPEYGEPDEKQQKKADEDEDKKSG